MRNEKRKSPAIDATDHTILITCDKCEWRELHDDRNAAWYALARHLKLAMMTPMPPKAPPEISTATTTNRGFVTPVPHD